MIGLCGRFVFRAPPFELRLRLHDGVPGVILRIVLVPLPILGDGADDFFGSGAARQRTPAPIHAAVRDEARWWLSLNPALR